MNSLIWIWAYPAPRFSPKYPPIPLGAETLVPSLGGVFAAGFLPASVGSPTLGGGILPEVYTMGWGGATVPAAPAGGPGAAGTTPQAPGAAAGAAGAAPEPLGAPIGGSNDA